MPSPARPSRDALWVGEGVIGGAGDPAAAMVTSESYWRTRRACEEYVRGRLLEHAASRRRVFVGFDFGYGYPRGLARALGLTGQTQPWRLVWNELARLIVDDGDNRNNRFAIAAELNRRCGNPTPGPLWGCPIRGAAPTLARTSPRFPYDSLPDTPLQRFRLSDVAMGGVQPAWKLLGIGSVGSQILLGIPVVCRLRDDPALAAFSLVWPYETGFGRTPTPPDGPFILHVEIWPGVAASVDVPSAPVRDQHQVRQMVRWLADLDGAGELAVLFDTPPGLSSEAVAICCQEEGWILGTSSRPIARRRTAVVARG